jgi:hypothetical protein
MQANGKGDFKRLALVGPLSPDVVDVSARGDMGHSEVRPFDHETIMGGMRTAGFPMVNHADRSGQIGSLPFMMSDKRELMHICFLSDFNHLFAGCLFLPYLLDRIFIEPDAFFFSLRIVILDLSRRDTQRKAELGPGGIRIADHWDVVSLHFFEKDQRVFTHEVQLLDNG